MSRIAGMPDGTFDTAAYVVSDKTGLGNRKVSLSAFAPSDYIPADMASAAALQAHIDDTVAHGGGGGTDRIIGETMLFLGVSPFPAGWYLLDGSPVDETTSLGVYLLSLGISSNGDGTVNLPDLRGKFPYMPLDSEGLMCFGGEREHTLITDEIPSHTHGIPLCYHDSTTYTNFPRSGTLHNYAHNTRASNTAGGGLAHNNMPPYFGLYLLIYGG